MNQERKAIEYKMVEKKRLECVMCFCTVGNKIKGYALLGVSHNECVCVDCIDEYYAFQDRED